MGLQASTVETVEALDSAFAEAMTHKGPSLIEVML
jgi:thiamine pyrophosphate-dependent acetolactate synthase large subunit-like protein